MRSSSRGLRSRDAQRSMIETLETRRMLSGNVNAAINGSGVLVITGDVKSNEIRVIAGGSSTFIVGLNGTTVNKGGQSNFGGFPDVSASMGNGDDSVELVDFFSQNATVVTDNGNDTVSVTIESFDSTFDNLNIDTGNGDDTVNLGGDSLVFIDLNVNLGRGNDNLNFTSFFDVFGNTTLNGGLGFDSITNVSFLFTFGTQTVVGFESIA